MIVLDHEAHKVDIIAPLDIIDMRAIEQGPANIIDKNILWSRAGAAALRVRPHPPLVPVVVDAAGSAIVAVAHVGLVDGLVVAVLASRFISVYGRGEVGFRGGCEKLRLTRRCRSGPSVGWVRRLQRTRL